MTLAGLLVSAALLGQGRAEALDATPEGRLDFMTATVGALTIEPAGTPGRALRLRPEPAFRMGKQYTAVVDGAIYLWLGEGGRPEAACQYFLVQDAGAPDGIWIYEFTSLSPDRIIARIGDRAVWHPEAPGLEFRPVPGAPRPADSEAARGRQLRALAREFRARDEFGEKGPVELRLLATPIARYGAEDSDAKDGALFAFVEGTDPEVFLFLEVRAGGSGPEWQYALAPMTVFAVEADLRGRAVWKLPWRKDDNTPDRPFFDFVDRQ